jgi:hypothetical protein
VRMCVQGEVPMGVDDDDRRVPIHLGRDDAA